MNASLILSTLAQASVLFAVTNIDHLILLTLWFVHGHQRPGTTLRICAGQYLGFSAILAATVILNLISGFVIPEAQLHLLGLIPLILGVKAGIGEILERRESNDSRDAKSAESKLEGKPVSVGAVALVTIANGGDEIGVYLPVLPCRPGGKSLCSARCFWCWLVRCWLWRGSLPDV